MGENERKAVFFDIDGTLVSEDRNHMIPQSTKRAIKALRQNNIYTFINTGRTYFNVDKPIQDLGFDGYVTGCGTYIRIDDKEILYKNLDKETERYILNLVRECDACPLYERVDSFYFDDKCRDIGGVGEIKDMYLMQGKDIENTPSNPNFGFDKFCIWYDKKTDIEKFKKGIKGIFDFIWRSEDFAEMVPCGYSKGTGIDVVAKKLGIKHENIYAVGDSLNDLPMMEHAGHKIVIGKDSPLAKYGDYVADDFYNDAVEKALKYFGLV